jgi:hypothetical protein
MEPRFADLTISATR